MMTAPSRRYSPNECDYYATYLLITAISAPIAAISECPVIIIIIPKVPCCTERVLGSFNSESTIFREVLCV